MIVKGSNNDFPIVPQGLHPAVCFRLIDVGTHEEVFQGVPYDRHIVFIVWELPTQQIEIDGETKPMAISNKYTLSLHPKSNLRKHLESWRGKKFTNSELVQGFELKNILGTNCQINVVHNESGDKTYANVDSVVPLSPGMQQYSLYNDLVCYEIDDGANIPETVPNWLREKIFASREFNERGQRNDEWGDNQIPQEPPGGIDPNEMPEDLPF